MTDKIDRNKWPVPDYIKGASARDAFLWYIRQAWPVFFGGEEEIEELLYHDMGAHILRRGEWVLELHEMGMLDKEHPARMIERKP